MIKKYDELTLYQIEYYEKFYYFELCADTKRMQFKIKSNVDIVVKQLIDNLVDSIFKLVETLNPAIKLIIDELKTLMNTITKIEMKMKFNDKEYNDKVFYKYVVSKSIMKPRIINKKIKKPKIRNTLQN